MMTKHLQERFDMLLGFVKNPSHNLTVSANVAAARELVDTLLHCGLLLPEEYRAYQAQITSARLIAGATELKRETDKVGF